MLEELIKSCSNLIWKISKSFYNTPKEDLYQAGVLGVIKAYQNFKDDGKTKFSTYAYMYIYGEMYLLASNNEIKLNKDIKRLINLIDKGRMKLTQEYLRIPSNIELAKYLNMDINVIEQIESYKHTFISLDDVNDEKRPLYEVIPEKVNVSIDVKEDLKMGINKLNPIEQNIIKERYYNDLTQSETAKKLGINQVMVSRYEDKGLKRLKNYMYM